MKDLEQELAAARREIEALKREVAQQKESRLRRRHRLTGLVRDAVADLVYYERKECEDWPLGEIEDLILDGVVSCRGLAMTFESALQEAVERRKAGR